MHIAVGLGRSIEIPVIIAAGIGIAVIATVLPLIHIIAVISGFQIDQLIDRNIILGGHVILDMPDQQARAW